MKPRLLAPLLAAGVIAVVGAALAQTAPQSRPAGYLAPGAAPDTLTILPKPPEPGSAREAADRDVFFKTRALSGTPRWTLAAEDANLAQTTGMFSCAVGATLDPARLPALSGVFRKIAIDTGPATEAAKEHYARQRPYTTADAGAAPVCVPKTDALTRSFSYPSGHSTLSWAWGLVLAEMAPDRASQILARARGIGDSRVVCGVHYLSDVEAGRIVGASLVSALHGQAAFRADMDHARTELATLRSGPHAAPSDCAVQDEAAEHAPY
jgi:acid phosphatase (class A)